MGGQRQKRSKKNLGNKEKKKPKVPVKKSTTKKGEKEE
jgi:hypothetical protein